MNKIETVCGIRSNFRLSHARTHTCVTLGAMSPVTVWRFGRLTTTGGPPSSSALKTLEIHSAQTVRQQVRQDGPEKEGHDRNSTQTDGSSRRHGSSNSSSQNPYQTVVWNAVTAVADVVYSVRGTTGLGEKYPSHFGSPLSSLPMDRTDRWRVLIWKTRKYGLALYIKYFWNRKQLPFLL